VRSPIKRWRYLRRAGGSMLFLPRTIRDTVPSISERKRSSSCPGKASPRTPTLDFPRESGSDTTRWATSPVFRRYSKISPTATSCTSRRSIINVSPGQTDGSMLPPVTFRCTVPNDRRTSSTNSHFRVRAAATRLWSSRLTNSSCLCDAPPASSNLPHDRAVVSNTLSKRKGGLWQRFFNFGVSILLVCGSRSIRFSFFTGNWPAKKQHAGEFSRSEHRRRSPSEGVFFAADGCTWARKRNQTESGTK